MILSMVRQISVVNFSTMFLYMDNDSRVWELVSQLVGKRKGKVTWLEHVTLAEIHLQQLPGAVVIMYEHFRVDG
jgi:hypothetical protein